MRIFGCGPVKTKTGLPVSSMSAVLPWAMTVVGIDLLFVILATIGTVMRSIGSVIRIVVASSPVARSVSLAARNREDSNGSIAANELYG